MKVVGVSSCISGLAHTPMAAKSLEKAGKHLGHDVKIEQQGAIGTINKLSTEAITKADVVLIAADQPIDGEERFRGKIIKHVKLTQAVSQGEAVLEKIAKEIKADGNQ